MGCRTKVEVMRDMDERTVVEEEWKNSGTTWTRNSFFEENGCAHLVSADFFCVLAYVFVNGLYNCLDLGILF